MATRTMDTCVSTAFCNWPTADLTTTTTSMPVSMMPVSMMPTTTTTPFTTMTPMTSGMTAVGTCMPTVSCTGMPMCTTTCTALLGACDVMETDAEFTITCDTPGMTCTDVTVVCKNDMLTMTGERKDMYRTCGSTCPKDACFLRTERSTTCFTRCFRVPVCCDTTKMRAVCCNGVLCVTIPKTTMPGASCTRVQVTPQ